MREPVTTISLPGPFAFAAGSAGGACPVATFGGGSVLCADAAVAPVTSAAKPTPARRAVSIRFMQSPHCSGQPSPNDLCEQQYRHKGSLRSCSVIQRIEFGNGDAKPLQFS